MIRRAAVVVATLMLAACGTTGRGAPEPRIVTIEKAVPVASPCVPASVGPAPQYKVTRESLAAAPNAAVRLAWAVAGMLERDERLLVVEPVVAGCPKEAS